MWGNSFPVGFIEVIHSRKLTWQWKITFLRIDTSSFMVVFFHCHSFVFEGWQSSSQKGDVHPTRWSEFCWQMVNDCILPGSNYPHRLNGIYHTRCWCSHRSHPVLRNISVTAFWHFHEDQDFPNTLPGSRKGMLPMLEPGIPTSVWQLSISQSLDLPSAGRKGKCPSWC